MKVGKEEIIGCLTALETWLNMDEKKIYAEWNGRVDRIRKLVDTVPGVKTDIYIPDDGNRYPTLKVSWDQAGLGLHHLRLRAQVAGKRSRHRSARCRQSQPGDGGSRRQSEPQRTKRSRPHRTGFHDHKAGRRNYCGANIAGDSEARHRKANPQPEDAEFLLRTVVRNRMRLLLVGFLLPVRARSAGSVRGGRSSAGLPPRIAVYSPGVDAGDYVYVSGQGPRRPDGSLPATFRGTGAASSRQYQGGGRSCRLDHGARGLHPGLSRGHQQVSRE